MNIYSDKPDTYVINPAGSFDVLTVDELTPYLDILIENIPEFALLTDAKELNMTCTPIHTAYGNTVATNIPMGLKVFISAAFAHDYGIECTFDFGLIGPELFKSFYARFKSSKYVHVYSSYDISDLVKEED